MNIDTFHLKGCTKVFVIPYTDEEKAVTDECWSRIAANQHRLAWSQDPAIAYLPPLERFDKCKPVAGSTVERLADGRVSVTIPREHSLAITK
jgi:hypothetical protein